MKAVESGACLRVAVVGLGGISSLHIRSIEKANGVKLAALCDLNSGLVATRSAELGVPGFTDMQLMITEVRPDIVTVATDDRSHAKLTLLAVRAGVRAVHCEKPMAVHPCEAREMVAVSEAEGVLLTINHQRRLGDVGAARLAIERGDIGEILELRGYCAGNLLDDGTHAIDSLLALAGDPAVNNVLGSMDLSEVKERYGHPSEKGARIEIETRHELQMSVATGSFATRRAYQEYHVLGKRGSLWRAGDQLKPNWFISDGKHGSHAPAFDRKLWFTHPQASEKGGPWRPLDTSGRDSDTGEVSAYEMIVESLKTGAPHPLDGRRTLQVQELITAGYQSGLVRGTVGLAETQKIDRFPLLMDAGKAV